MNIPTDVQEMDYELYPKNAFQMWEAYRGIQICVIKSMMMT